MHDIRILWQASPPITFNPNATWPEMANSNEARQTFAKLWRLFQQIQSPAWLYRIATKLRHPLFPAGVPKWVAHPISVANGWHMRADIECTLRVGLGGCVRTILLPSRSLNQEVGFAIYASGS